MNLEHDLHMHRIKLISTILAILATTACTSAPTTATFFGLGCPLSQSLTSPDGRPMTATYQAPTISGGVAPVTTSCSPSSGSSMPLGFTLVTCSAQDARQTTASCQFEVQVVSNR